MEFNKKVQIALGEMFKDAKLEKVATPKKVKLANYDFKRYMQDYDKSFTKFRSAYKNGINTAKSATDKHFEEVFDILDKAEKEMDTFGNKAEEIGLDFRDTKQYKEFQDLKIILLSRTSVLKEKQKEISKLM